MSSIASRHAETVARYEAALEAGSKSDHTPAENRLVVDRIVSTLIYEMEARVPELFAEVFKMGPVAENSTRNEANVVKAAEAICCASVKLVMYMSRSAELNSPSLPQHLSKASAVCDVNTMTRIYKGLQSVIESSDGEQSAPDPADWVETAVVNPYTTADEVQQVHGDTAANEWIETDKIHTADELPQAHSDTATDVATKLKQSCLSPLKDDCVSTPIAAETDWVKEPSATDEWIETDKIHTADVWDEP
jgi:hypothetical protein